MCSSFPSVGVLAFFYTCFIPFIRDRATYNESTAAASGTLNFSTAHIKAGAHTFKFQIGMILKPHAQVEREREIVWCETCTSTPLKQTFTHIKRCKIYKHTRFGGMRYDSIRACVFFFCILLICCRALFAA